MDGWVMFGDMVIVGLGSEADRWRSTSGTPIMRAFKTVVGVAQLVELRVVIPAVVGSSPIVHPIFYCP